jgi:hypothetical protein
MTITRYKTLYEARKSHWEFNTDRAYYQKLRDMFQFFSQLQVKQVNPHGVFRYSSLKVAGEQEIVWKVKKKN